MVIKVRYIDGSELHFLNGREVWIKGKAEVGDLLHLVFFPRKNRFGETMHIPYLDPPSESNPCTLRRNHDDGTFDCASPLCIFCKNERHQ